jgi:hypothetical protein
MKQCQNYILKLRSQKVCAHFSQKLKNVFEKGLKNTIMLVLELCTMRQTAGNSILHVQWHHFKIKIAIKCVRHLHWITKGKTFPGIFLFALFNSWKKFEGWQVPVK